jgi:hypothetical protein
VSPNRREVSEDENILRYVSLTGYDPDANIVNGSAFDRKPKDDDGLSVTRVGVFSDDAEEDLRQIRFVSSKWLTIRKSGRFAELNVGSLYRALARLDRDIQDVSVVENPLEALNGKPANPAHALILGLPFRGEAVGSLTSELAGDLIRRTVIRLHPAALD